MRADSPRRCVGSADVAQLRAKFETAKANLDQASAVTEPSCDLKLACDIGATRDAKSLAIRMVKRSAPDALARAVV